MKRTFLILGLLYLTFHFLFLWIYTNIDGYFYWAIGHYFKTGVYPFISPFIYAKPITISPPLYGLFLALIGSAPRGDILLHLTHIMLIASTTILLFWILTDIVSDKYAALLSFLFLIFPANVIYVGSMMTEIPAQTAMTLYVYLVHRFIKTHAPSLLGYAVALTAIMTVLKYQFVILFVLTLCYFAWIIWRKKKRHMLPVISALLGVVIICIWIVTNHTITGIWGLSDTKKMPFYTNFVWDGNHFPKETDASVIALRRYIPASANRYGEYWDLQNYILPYTHRQWYMVDELLGNVGIAAIRQYPLEYATNGIRIFITTLIGSAPWFHNLQTFGSTDSVQPLYCDSLDSIRFCQPIIQTPFSFALWNTYVSFTRKLYDMFVPPLLFFIFLPSLIITLCDRHTKIRIYSLIYLFNLIPISYLSMVEPRYLIPYYPLIVIIITLAIHKCIAVTRVVYKTRI